MSELLKARLNRDRLARETLSIITYWIDYEEAESIVESIAMQGDYCETNYQKIVSRPHPDSPYIKTMKEFNVAAKAVYKLERQLAWAQGERYCHCGRTLPV